MIVLTTLSSTAEIKGAGGLSVATIGRQITVCVHFHNICTWGTDMLTIVCCNAR